MPAGLVARLAGSTPRGVRRCGPGLLLMVGGAARGSSRDLALPAAHSPQGKLGALGHAFALLLDNSALDGRTYLQDVGTPGAVGAPLDLEGANQTATGFMTVPTSLGAMLVYTTERGAPDHVLSVAPLRVCD